MMRTTSITMRVQKDIVLGWMLDKNEEALAIIQEKILAAIDD